MNSTAMLALLFVLAPGADLPPLVESVRDLESGKTEYRVAPFDTIEMRSSRTLYVELDWCPRPREADEWRQVRSLLVRNLGAQGKQRIPEEDVVRVIYWEQRVLVYVRDQLVAGGNTPQLEALLRKLREVNPRWNVREREAYEVDLQLRHIQRLVTRRDDSPDNATQALKLLETLLVAHRSDNSVRAEYARIHALLGLEALKRDDHRVARDRCRDLERHVPESEYTRELRARMRQVASDLRGKALAAADAGRGDEKRRLEDAVKELMEGDRTATIIPADERWDRLVIGGCDQAPRGTLFPARTQAQRLAVALTHEPLFETPSHSTRHVRGRMVEAAHLKNNGLNLELTLVEGGRFSDGQPFSAAHVQQSLEVSRGTGVRDVRLLGSRSLSIAIAPSPLPLEPLAVPFLAAALPARRVAASGSSNDQPDPLLAWVGTGPYVIDRQSIKASPRQLGFRAREDNDGERVGNGATAADAAESQRIREVIYRQYESKQLEQALTDLTRNDLHLLYPVFAADIERSSQPSLAGNLRPIRTESVWILALNHRHALLRERDARRALFLALPREQILRDAMSFDLRRGRHRVATGPFPPQSPATEPGLAVTMPDPVAARDLVKSLRMRKPDAWSRPLRLLFPEHEPGATEAMKVIAAAATDVGFTIELIPLASDEYFERVYGRHDFEIAYHRLDHASALYDVRHLFGIDPQQLAPGGGNFLGYEDEDLWQLLIDATRGRTGVDVFQRQQQVHHRVHDQLAILPLWWLEQYAVVSPRLKQRLEDGETRAVDLHPLDLVRDVETWFLDSSTRSGPRR